MFSRHLLHSILAIIGLALSCETSEAAKRMPVPPPRYPFTIDPNTPLKDLLPSLPGSPVKLPGVLNEDLARVPELMFAKPLAKDLEFFASQKETAHQMAKINHLNQRTQDGFLKAFLEKRDDLRGMPFLLGKDCRTKKDKAATFNSTVRIVQQHLSNRIRKLGRATPQSPEDDINVSAQAFWKEMDEYSNEINHDEQLTQQPQADLDQALVAALMQMVTPLPEPYRAGLVKYLRTIDHADASRGLAKLALYSPEAPIRTAAVDGLKTRKPSEYTDVLMAGFRYPLPAVSKRAAEAMVKLQIKEEIPNLVNVLEEPDPRAPATKKVGGSEVTYVRELVRVNHHHNCLLCHAPGNTKDTPQTTLQAPVPQPSQALPSPFQGYGSRQSPDIFVRIDMTYLRQDFSIMMQVDDAKPWPEKQRFDFFVRTRDVTAKEAAEYSQQLVKQTPGNHQAAQFALRGLTGRTPVDATAQGWRRELKLP